MKKVYVNYGLPIRHSMNMKIRMDEEIDRIASNYLQGPLKISFALSPQATDEYDVTIYDLDDATADAITRNINKIDGLCAKVAVQ